ncbi:flagellar biosynthesis protein FlhF [Cytobacillus firmus]|uniref:Flagellar biosynthesis protein FlhF n=2 Tax=Cytobacillus TaxID=2675230 RepID=A0A366K0P5_CYTFI|nr:MULTISPECIES: flagellar biosynthesis protein FlhF [Cytobacillus]RBP95264.1 flagellar biosynthesis protein FlhF [Cytobacillus firmus]TDX44105.1 flagellar biosynthesis protein FlhF [Cytobacillus oceanisediminis]
MKVKKFMAASMPDAMKQIRTELGKDAVILNSRVVYTGGVLGFFKKRIIEVMAAVDSNQELEQKPSVKPAAVPAPSDHYRGNAGEAQISSLKTSDELIRELSSLKEMISSFAGAQQEGSIYPEAIRKALFILDEQEIEKSVQVHVLQALLEKWYLCGANAKDSEIEDWLHDELIKQIEDIPFGGMSLSKKYINVAGPTGVGKTTTLAKMAAECVIKHRKKAAFITADTYRIAAIDQLKTYASILNIPLEVCYTIEDFRQAADKLKEYDVVLIDTAGRNFRNKQYVEDLKNVIDFENEMETFLVLSLTSKQKDMEEIYNQFSIIDIDKLIFTKADETSTYGSMYNIIHKYKKGAAYITNGQDVPDDILMAGPEAIVKQLMGNKK